MAITLKTRGLKQGWLEFDVWPTASFDQADDVNMRRSLDNPLQPQMHAAGWRLSDLAFPRGLFRVVVRIGDV